MQKSYPLLTTILLSLTIFPACQKPAATTPHFLKANINGTPFVATSISYYPNPSSYSQYTEISGSNAGGEIDIFLYKFSGATGTIPLTTLSAGISYTQSGTTSHTSMYGAINITAVSPEITGTFYFTTSDSSKVTDGSFNAETK